MRGLAEFIMRGRWQALAVVVLGAGSLLFGWLSAAAVALVTLRKGVADGAWLVFWALLPAVLAAWMSGDIGSVVLLVGTFALAVVLRLTVSLALAVLASVALGAVGGSASGRGLGERSTPKWPARLPEPPPAAASHAPSASATIAREVGMPRDVKTSDPPRRWPPPPLCYSSFR